MTRVEAEEQLRHAEGILLVIWRAVYQGDVTPVRGYLHATPALDMARQRVDAACAAWLEAIGKEDEHG
jgi:hypothetical protein